jgi:glycosyltransferase involved in cell wall biosynthesis
MTKPQKILIAYSSRPPIIDYLKRAFSKLDVDAHGFYADENHWFDRHVIHQVNKTAHNLRLLPKSRDLFRDHPLKHLNFRSSGILEAVEEHSPELVLIVRGIRFTDQTLKKLRERSVLFGWWIEKEERMDEAFGEIDLFDHYFFMNSSCIEEGNRRGFGEKISLLPHSVDTSVFHPVRCDELYDWCFVGGWSEKRQVYVEKALEVSGNGAVWGPKWIKKNRFNPTFRRVIKGEYIEGPDLVRLYNESSVVLNVTNWGFGEGEKRSGVNMRVLEVPACGVCLLTDGSRDLKRLVTPENHVIVYEGVEGFMEKLTFLLENPKVRKGIGLSGYNHVKDAYTYDSVARKVIERYGLGVPRQSIK